MLKYLILFSIAGFLSLLLTPVVRKTAIRLGVLDLPGERKVHTRPTPRLGGMSIFLIFNAVFFFSSTSEFFFFPANYLEEINFGWLFLSSAMVFAIGALDDIRRLPPGLKLLFQILAASIVATTCCRMEFITLPFFGPLDLGPVSIPATVLWIVAITNAINLLDGLDGLAAGTALIICAAMFGISLLQQDIGTALISAILAGSILGFLKYNFHPASIFLGDSGAYYLGFLLSVLSLLSKQKGSTAIAILIPMTVLGLPIIDTFLSMLRRLLASLHILEVDPDRNLVRFLYFDSWSVFRADKDHIHHRLLQMGFTHAKAVFLLYGISLGLGGLALSAVYFQNINYALLITTIALAAYIGIKKLGYREIQVLSNGALLSLFNMPMASQRIPVVFVDMAVISLSYYLAFLLRFEGYFFPWKGYYISTLPLILITKIVIFHLMGLYNGIWRFTGVDEVLKVLKAVFMGSLISGLLLAILPGYSIQSHALLIIDLNLLFVLVAGARGAFRILEHLHALENHQGKKVLIYGVGKTGVFALKEILNNPMLGLKPVGFIDDNPWSQRRQVNGYPVLGTLESLEQVLKKNSISEVILAIREVPKEKLDHLFDVCSSFQIPLCRFQHPLTEIRAI